MDSKNIILSVIREFLQEFVKSNPKVIFTVGFLCGLIFAYSGVFGFATGIFIGVYFSKVPLNSRISV